MGDQAYLRSRKNNKSEKSQHVLFIFAEKKSHVRRQKM